jgi:hypothetical protein
VWGLTDDALLNAIYMNMTGFFVYYAYERICNYVPYGIRENKE